jgi:hypothetical protein
MLSQSILSTVTYSPPLSSTLPALESVRSFSHLPTHSSLALSILRTLSQLSFVITKFGGVTSTSSAGLAELKRVFYSALDILSADVESSETFVKELNSHGWSTQIPCTTSSLICLGQTLQVRARENVQRMLSPALVKHSISHVSINWSHYSARTQLNTMSSLYAFRKRRPSSSLLYSESFNKASK